MAKSLPPVSAKVIADIEQFVAEFKRAENVTRRFTNDVDKELSQLSKQMKGKFSLGDVGKDILKGAGLFGGFDIAQTASEKMVDYFREAAEYAKQIEDSTQRQLEMTLKSIESRQTDSQRREFLEKEVRRAEDALRTAQSKGHFTETTMGANFKVTTRSGVRPLSSEETAEVHKAGEALGRAAKALEDFNVAAKKRESDKQVKEWADLATAVKAAGGEIRSMAEIRSGAGSAAASESGAVSTLTDDLVELREKYLDLGDPMRKYQRQLEDIAELHRMGVKGFGDDEMLAAQIKVWGDMADAINKVGDARSGAEVRGTVNAATEFKDETKELAAAARDMGWAFSSAFEDAILEGEKLSDVTKGLLKDIARIALRTAITQPLGNWVGAGIKGMLGFAEGGEPPVGVPSIVGERGPEIFVPKTAGTIIPNHELGGGGPVVVNQTYHIGAGVTAQQLMPILQLQKREIIATIADSKRRRQGVGAAMA